MILLVTFELFCLSWSWSGPRPGFFPRMMLIYVFGKAFGLSVRGFSKAETRFRPSSCRKYARVKESWRSCPSARRRTTEHMFPDSVREYVSVCCVFVFLEPRTETTRLQFISTVVFLHFKFRFTMVWQQDVESIEFVTEPDVLIMLQPEISLHRHVSWHECRAPILKQSGGVHD